MSATKDGIKADLPKSKPGKQPIHYPFWYGIIFLTVGIGLNMVRFGGSASCFAATVTHPLDLGKLDLPLSSGSRTDL